jgi:uncharacterized protein (TIGR02391 family)
MIERYIALNRLISTMMRHCINAFECDGHDDGTVLALMHEYVRDGLRELKRLWPEGLSTEEISQLNNMIDEEFEKTEIRNLYLVIEGLKYVQDDIDEFFGKQNMTDISVTILDFLHPLIIANSYNQYRNSHYRDAVLNAFISVFDLIRSKTGIQKDGAALVGESLSLENPKLIISTLETESGRDEQKGMIQLLQGAYLAIRNPKAHSLLVHTNQHIAAQNLVFASLLARIIESSHVVRT